MGNQSSLTAKQIEEAEHNCDFAPEEIQQLFKKFNKLDTNHSGSLSAEKFLAVPELENNPLVRRVVATLDANQSGDVDFMEFISVLSVFAHPTMEEKKHSQSDRQTKLCKFTFRLYDVDGDGYISNADLYQILKSMVGNNLNDTQLQQLVDRTIRQGDKDMDGRLSYEEYLDMIKNEDLQSKLNIDLFPPHK